MCIRDRATAQAVVDAIIAAVNAFGGHTAQVDDLTVVAVKRMTNDE